ncbi:MAG: hypothetical protein E7391_08825 [Ruminococcaceae bacterium]|nr:hypothetical protein [Oscillospiraceae bacterium]
MKKLILILIVIALAFGGYYAYKEYIEPEKNYKDAISMIDNYNYPEAFSMLQQLDGYKDSTERMMALYGNTVSAGRHHTVAVKNDGTVVAAGRNTQDQCNVEDWKDIAYVSCGYDYTAALKDDGTVVFAGQNSIGKGDFSNWSDIVAISSGEFHTLGLKKDGTVVATGGNDFGQCNVSEWKDIVSVKAVGKTSVGLKKDGTIVMCGKGLLDKEEIEKLTGVVDFDLCGEETSIFMKKDGTVECMGFLKGIKPDIDDATKVCAGNMFALALKKDKTIAVIKDDTKTYEYGQLNVDAWKDIVDFSAYENLVIAVDKNGQVFATGEGFSKETDVNGWNLNKY